MTSLPVLETRGLVKEFGGIRALADLDLTLYEGEILGLIGPNGAGKTTFINVVTGLDRATGGEIRLRGESITKASTHHIARLGLARTFQVTRPFRHLSVLENVAVGAMFGSRGSERNTRAAFDRAEEVVDLVGLRPRMTAPADRLTIPDLKRLELAKALAMSPRILLLDEVMAGLHGAEVGEAMELLRQIHASGITLLVVEHLMKAIMGLSQRIVVLEFGSKIAEGTPEEIVANPRVIAAYLGKRYAKRQGQDARRRTP